MSTVARLKKQAAEFEQKKQFDRALAKYIQLLDALGDRVDEADIALFNRVGDMLMRQGSTAQALDYYERAVDLYGDGGFFNNAIALCNKILRSAPGRTAIYYKLGRVSARKGFIADAKQNYLEYAGRVQRAGNVDEALRALSELVELCPELDDVRLLLAEELARSDRKAEAVVHLQSLYAKLLAEGRSSEARATEERMRAIDPAAVPRSGAARPTPRAGELVFLDVGDGAFDRAAPGGHGSPGSAGTPPAMTVEPAVEGRAAAVDGGPLVHDAAELEVPAVAEDLDLLDAATAMDGALELPVLQLEEDDAPFAAAPPEGLAIGAMLESATSPSGEEQAPASLEGLEQSYFPGDAAAADAAASPMARLGLEPMVAEDALDAGDLPLLDAGEMDDPAASWDGAASAPESEDRDPTAADVVAALPDLPLLDTDADEGSPTEAPQPTGQGETDFDIQLEQAGSLISEDGTEDDERAPSLRISRGTVEVSLDDLDLSFDVDSEGVASDAEPPASARLAALVAERPHDWTLRQQLGEALLEDGERAAGMAALEAALTGREHDHDFAGARGVLEVLLRTDPNSVGLYQKRVELAVRSGDRAQLVEAYLALADCLVRSGDVAKAHAVSARALELAPTDPRALGGLASDGADPAPAGVMPPASALAPAPLPQPPTPAGDEAFVNLADWLRDEGEPRSTRMIAEVEEAPPSGQVEFAEMLTLFKQGVAANLEETDHDSHYDLGVAYKEMGLLDEAIAEFQKALRGTEHRVRTYEALGQCFVEKRQYQVAVTILSRALAGARHSDDTLLGVLYLLGVATEALGRREEAMGYYERVFALDIEFRDVTARMSAVERRAT